MVGVVTAGAAVVGANWSGSNISSEIAAQQLHEAAVHTLESRSFTEHTVGESLDYQAPNLTQVTEGSSSQTEPVTFVTAGSDTYIHFGPEGGWLKQPGETPPFYGGVSQALGYLRGLSVFPHATVNGDVYTVHGVLSKLPESLVSLLFTVAGKTSSGSEVQVENVDIVGEGRVNVTGQIVVRNGRVTSETFEAPGVRSPSESGHHPARGTVTYSRFDSSPHITVPTEAQIHSYPASCSAASHSVSCQISAPSEPVQIDR
jgi:hypothetical protein